MAKLIECPGCTRHVRADDRDCPFCGRPSTTAAPSLVLGLVLPLTLMAAACTSESPPASKTEASEKKAEAKPADPRPEPVTPVQPSEPADGGAAADPSQPSEDRVMATKYGGPPVMNDPVPTPIDAIEPEAVAEPEEVRPAKKYGAPPRPAPKYGGPPKPGSGSPKPL